MRRHYFNSASVPLDNSFAGRQSKSHASRMKFVAVKLLKWKEDPSNILRLDTNSVVSHEEFPTGGGL